MNKLRIYQLHKTEHIKNYQPSSSPGFCLSLWRLVMLSLSRFRFSWTGNKPHPPVTSMTTCTPHPTDGNILANDLYMLITYGAGPLLVVELPGLELLDSFVHGDFSHFHSLLQWYELPLPGCFHASVGVVDGGEGLVHRLTWTCENRHFSSDRAMTPVLMSIKHTYLGNKTLSIPRPPFESATQDIRDSIRSLAYN